MKPKQSGGGGGVIRCSGPCRRRFRSEIVTPDRSVANALLTSDPAESGLYWFCADCRTEVAVQSEDDREDYLPPELWLTIFELLDGASILKARSTCHRWKAIVDGSRTLHTHFTVNFEKLTMDRSYKPEDLPPAACFIFQTVKILEVGTWWPSFGAGITIIGFYDCEIALSTLLGMLKKTTNLEVLSLNRLVYSSVEESTADFRLEKLTDLRSHRVFNIFEQIFPRLVQLDVSTEEEEEFNEEAVCGLIRSSMRTLKELKSPLTPYLIDQIEGINHLKLNIVRQEGGHASAVQLSRIQRFIKELEIAATNEELCEVGQHLRLEEIDVTLKPSGTTLKASFLAEMPQLKSLTLRGNQEKLIFSGFKNRNLKYLTLIFLQITIDDLQSYLGNCSNVDSLRLSDCTLTSWGDLFAAEFPSLRSLSLSRIKVLKCSTAFNSQHNFIELNFYYCNLPEEILIQLLRQCPRLEQLEFLHVNGCTDETVEIVCQLPLLVELTIFGCPVTDRSVELITANCGRLRLLYVSGCEQVSNAARKQLVEFKRTH